LWKDPDTAVATIVLHQTYERTNFCIRTKLQCQYIVIARQLLCISDNPKPGHYMMKLSPFLTRRLQVRSCIV
jgi:hypothetical protein